MKFYTTFLFMLILAIAGYSQGNPGADSVNQNGIFTRVDVEAEFPGGAEGWKQYLQKNLNPTIPIDRGAPAGKFTVLAQFVVDADGSISDITAISEEGYGMEQEVVRIIRKSGTWSPAVLNGKKVKAYRIQPVVFIVSDDQIDINTKTPYVLYAGIDNELDVRVTKVKSEHIQVTIAGGTVIPQGNGRFIVRIKKTGRVMVRLYNIKKDKPIGAVSFEVLSK